LDSRDRAKPQPRLQGAPAERTASSDGATPAQSLRPEVALQLLEQSGHGPLPGTPGTDAWLQALIDALVDLSSRDALTGLANRRSFELALAREIDRVARSGEPALLLTLDIDHFKRVNDTHGHAAGDQVIRAVGRVLAETVRPMDLVARVGGEEFAIVLPNCPAAFGPQVAERIRTCVARQPVEIAPGEHVNVTVSVGVRSRRNGCAPLRACGWIAPTCSCTAPRARAAIAAAWNPPPFRW
jgi:diguanylate cyclase (GGDEF)-like protein